jgi:bacteriorhodopsin
MKIIKQNFPNDAVIFSFMITYTILLTTATITLIEALRTKTPYVRHILNLETCISFVAGYYYGIFITKVQNTTIPINWNDITKLRYLDWCITTPMMLITLCLVLGMHSKQKIYLKTITSIILLNYAMIGIGYFGEVYKEYQIFTMICGFIPFCIMFYVIYEKFYGKQKNILANKVIFFIYLLVWSLYGIVYLLPEIYKNICYNILDLIAKCLVGLGLWAYYAHIIYIK